MSKFKLFKSYLVDIGTSVSSAKDEIKKYILEAGWRVLAESGTSLDVIPATDVGNDVGTDVLRITFSSSDISMSGAMSYTKDFPSSYSVYTQASGKLNSYGRKLVLSIDGVDELTIDMSSKSTLEPKDFNNYLIEQLNSTINPRVSKYIFSIYPYSEEYILAKERVPLTGGVITANTGSSNTRRINSAYTKNTIVTSEVYRDTSTRPSSSVEVNYGTGFIYYLSIHERTISIATKTTSKYSPPITCTFADHIDAINNCPKGCAPIELLITKGIPSQSGTTSSANFNSNYSYITTHVYTLLLFDSRGASEDNVVVHPTAKYFLTPSTQWQDSIPNKISNYQRVLFSSGTLIKLGFIWPGASQSGNVDLLNSTTSKLYPLSTAILSECFLTATGNNSSSNSHDGGSSYVPSMKLEDIFSFIGVATDESLHLMQDYSVRTALTSDVSAGDLEVQVTSTEGFPSAGTITIDSEIIEYSGKTDTSFTGLSRGRYGSNASGHITSASSYLVLWYTKIGQSALMAGYTKPT